MKVSLDETVFWMKVSLDEPVFGWKCRGWNCHLFWMKMVLDESVFGRNRFWMKVFLDEFFFSNLDESVPNRLKCLHSRITHSCHRWWAVERLLFVVSSFWLSRVSLLLIALPLPLLLVVCPELLPCGQRQGNHALRFRQLRSLALGQNSLLPQVMSPSTSTTSTTQRLLQWSSRMKLATIRSLRTRAMRNSTMRLSEKRNFHHCFFGSYKNKRTWEKLITLMKKVCCQLSLVPHTSIGRPVYEQSSCPKRKSSR